MFGVVAKVSRIKGLRCVFVGNILTAQSDPHLGDGPVCCHINAIGDHFLGVEVRHVNA